MDSGSTGDETTQTISSAQAPAEASEGLPGLAPPETPETPVDLVPTEEVAPGEEAAPSIARPRNLLALLGVILAVPVWPAGLVLSALGLFTAVTRRTGKVVALVGLALSVATGGAIVAVLADATSTVAASAALDPGCTGIEAKLSTDLATLKSDTATLQSDEDDAVSSSGSIEAVTTDLSGIESDLTAAGTDATHAEVKSDLSTMNTQVQAVGTELTGIQNHSTSSEGAAAAALTTLQGTDAKLDALCGTY